MKKKAPIQRLEQGANNPQRRRLEKLAPGGIFNLWRQINIQRAIAYVAHDIDVLKLDQPGSTVKGRILVKVSVDNPANEQKDDNRRSEVILKEGLGILGSDRDVELSNEAHTGEEHANPAANDTEGGGEGEFVDIPTVILPCLSEADVGEANTTPNEQGANTGQSQQPVEDDTTGARGLVDESEKTEGDLEENAVQGTSGLVDVCKELRSHAARSQSLDGTGRAEGCGVGHTDDGNSDDSVHDRWQATNTGILDRDDEGRGLSVGTGGTEQVVRVAGNNQADDESTQEVEDHDTPEDLLGGLGEGLGRVGSLGSSKTAQLCSTEGKGCSREDGAEALEGGERTRVMPVVSSDISTLGCATAVDHDTEDDETDDGDDLDETENEFDWGGYGLVLG